MVEVLELKAGLQPQQAVGSADRPGRTPCTNIKQQWHPHLQLSAHSRGRLVKLLIHVGRVGRQPRARLRRSRRLWPHKTATHIASATANHVCVGRYTCHVAVRAASRCLPKSMAQHNHCAALPKPTTSISEPHKPTDHHQRT